MCGLHSTDFEEARGGRFTRW